MSGDRLPFSLFGGWGMGNAPPGGVALGRKLSSAASICFNGAAPPWYPWLVARLPARRRHACLTQQGIPFQLERQNRPELPHGHRPEGSR